MEKDNSSKTLEEMKKISEEPVIIDPTFKNSIIGWRQAQEQFKERKAKLNQLSDKFHEQMKQESADGIKKSAEFSEESSR
jgi:hypothetical protein